MAEFKPDDPNWESELLEKLKPLNHVQARVGWFENAREEDGTPSAYIASIHEYGVPDKNIPPRLGLRGVTVKQDKKWGNLAGQGLKRVIEGNLGARELLELIARQVFRDFKKRISSNPPPPLKPATISARRRKGLLHEETMVATGRMIEGLDVKVEDV